MIHAPLGDGVFTRCRECLEWWPCTTRRNESDEVDEERRAELLAEARKALKGDEP